MHAHQMQHITSNYLWVRSFISPRLRYVCYALSSVSQEEKYNQRKFHDNCPFANSYFNIRKRNNLILAFYYSAFQPPTAIKIFFFSILTRFHFLFFI
jgi:hypothetical protein